MPKGLLFPGSENRAWSEPPRSASPHVPENFSNSIECSARSRGEPVRWAGWWGFGKMKEKVVDNAQRWDRPLNPCVPLAIKNSHTCHTRYIEKQLTFMIAQLRPKISGRIAAVRGFGGLLSRRGHLLEISAAVRTARHARPPFPYSNSPSFPFASLLLRPCSALCILFSLLRSEAFP